MIKMVSAFGPRQFKYVLGVLPLLLLLIGWGLQLVAGLPLPKPQVIVRSQSLLYPQQPGRQVDLSHVLPTTELFWLNIEEGYFACQVNSSEKFLKIFRLSRLCDGIVDCYEGSDELGELLKCSRGCNPANCNSHGVCLASTAENQCHCDDGYGGKSCEMADVNECRQSPCSIHAECTNTLGSYFCTCRVGYTGDGFECSPLPDLQDRINADSGSQDTTTAVSAKNDFSTSTISAIIDTSDLPDNQSVTLRTSTVVITSQTSSDFVAGTASSVIVDGFDEPPRQSSNTESPQQTVSKVVTTDNETTEKPDDSKIVFATESLDASDVNEKSKVVTENVESTTTSSIEAVSISSDSSTTATTSNNQNSPDVEPFSGTVPGLPIEDDSSSIVSSTLENKNVEETDIVSSTTVITPNQENVNPGESDQTTVASVGTSSDTLNGFQIPNSVGEVLSNVKIAVDDFIKHHQPSDDNSSQPFNQQQSVTQAVTVATLTTSTTEAESVINIISVATPDTSNVSGSTNVVNKVKDILSGLIPTPDDQNQTESPSEERFPEYDTSNGNKEISSEAKDSSISIPEYETDDSKPDSDSSGSTGDVTTVSNLDLIPATENTKSESEKDGIFDDSVSTTTTTTIATTTATVVVKTSDETSAAATTDAEVTTASVKSTSSFVRENVDFSDNFKSETTTTATTTTATPASSSVANSVDVTTTTLSNTREGDVLYPESNDYISIENSGLLPITTTETAPTIPTSETSQSDNASPLPITTTETPPTIPTSETSQSDNASPLPFTTTVVNLERESFPELPDSATTISPVAAITTTATVLDFEREQSSVSANEPLLPESTSTQSSTNTPLFTTISAIIETVEGKDAAKPEGIVTTTFSAVDTTTPFFTFEDLKSKLTTQEEQAISRTESTLILFTTSQTENPADSESGGSDEQLKNRDEISDVAQPGVQITTGKSGEVPDISSTTKPIEANDSTPKSASTTLQPETAESFTTFKSRVEQTADSAAVSDINVQADTTTVPIFSTSSTFIEITTSTSVGTDSGAFNEPEEKSKENVEVVSNVGKETTTVPPSGGTEFKTTLAPEPLDSRDQVTSSTSSSLLIGIIDGSTDGTAAVTITQQGSGISDSDESNSASFTTTTTLSSFSDENNRLQGSGISDSDENNSASFTTTTTLSSFSDETNRFGQSQEVSTEIPADQGSSSTQTLPTDNIELNPKQSIDQTELVLETGSVTNPSSIDSESTSSAPNQISDTISGSLTTTFSPAGVKESSQVTPEATTLSNENPDSASVPQVVEVTSVDLPTSVESETITTTTTSRETPVVTTGMLFIDSTSSKSQFETTATTTLPDISVPERVTNSQAHSSDISKTGDSLTPTTVNSVTIKPNGDVVTTSKIILDETKTTTPFTTTTTSAEAATTTPSTTTIAPTTSIETTTMTITKTSAETTTTTITTTSAETTTTTITTTSAETTTTPSTTTSAETTSSTTIITSTEATTPATTTSAVTTPLTATPALTTSTEATTARGVNQNEVKQRNEGDESKSDEALEEILKPCADNFFICNETGLGSQCLTEFDKCSMEILSDKNKTGGLIPEELTETIEQEPKDKELTSSLLQCILDNQNCIESKRLGCMPTYNSCALKALEDSRKRRLRILDENQLPASRASDESEIDDLNKKLSGNFTLCVQSYTQCTAKASIALEVTECVERFHACSLQLLKEAELEDKGAQGGIVFEPVETPGITSENKKLSSSLFACIQEYVMCLMRKDNWCMRDYNNCTLIVLDRDNKAKQDLAIDKDVETKNDFQGSQNQTLVEDDPGREGSIEIDSSSPSSSSVTDETSSTTTTSETSSVSVESSTSDSSSNQNSETSTEGITIDLPPECGPNDGPVTFGSFSGRPAQSLADCTWDFFGCTNRAGQWPSNKVCCQARFDACCMKIMGGKKKPGQGHEPFEKPSTPTTGTSTGTTPRPQTQPNNPPPQHQTQDPKDKIQLIDCIWNYMGCAKRNDKPDKECKEDFNVCSMIAMGMAPPPTEQAASTTTTPTTTTTTTTRSPISDIDLPELPDFLKPDSSTTGRPLTPIQDIDLPDGFEVVMEGGHNLDSSKQEEPSEFMQCLLRLYKCQENGETRCKDVELCQKPVEPITSTSKPVEPIVSEPEETSVRPVTSSSSKPPLQNPVSSSGSSETQCVWAYFSCGRQRSQAECQKRFDACSAGKNPDNEICAEVAENPQNYLVPHPDDCTKFYSCQNLGWKGGWIAHLMDCPATTGFDVNLRICNYIKALPRCSQEKSLTLFHEVDGVAARQTRHNQDALNVPEFGYLSSDRDPEIRPVDPKTSPKSAAPEKISISFVFTFVTTLIATLLVM